MWGTLPGEPRAAALSRSLVLRARMVGYPLLAGAPARTTIKYNAALLWALLQYVDFVAVKEVLSASPAFTQVCFGHM